MNYTEKVFVELIANTIFEKKEAPVVDWSMIDVEQLIELSNINSNVAVIYSSLKRIDDAPKELLETFKIGFSTLVMRYSKYKTVYEIITKALDDNHINYAVFKGISLAKLYPSEELRSMSDIDVLVSKTEFEDAKNVLANIDNASVYENIKIDTEELITIKDIDIELHNSVTEHRNMSGEIDYNKFFGDMIEHTSEIDGVKTIEPSLNFKYIIYHMAQHFYYSGCGARMITDAALLIKKYSSIFDWDNVLKDLDQMGLKKFTLNIFAICKLWFGIEPPVEVDGYDASKIDKISSYCLEGGVFGKKNTSLDIENIKKHRQVTGQSEDSMFRWLFPSNAYMKKTSEWYKNKSSILLPVAYAERFVRFVKNRGGLRNSAKITKQTKSDLKKHEEMISLVGLE